MRILFICKGTLSSAGIRNLSFDLRYINGLIRNGHSVLTIPASSLRKINNPLNLRFLGERRLLRELLESAELLKPDVVLISHASIVSPTILEAVRRTLPGTPIGHLSVDALFAPANLMNIKATAKYVDALFITTGGVALETISHYGCPAYFIPNITDSSLDLGRAFSLEDPSWSVSCFMSEDTKNAGGSGARIELALGLQRHLSTLRYCYRGFAGNKPINGAAALDIYANSACALNLTRATVGELPPSKETRHLYSSDRLAHITGNGALALIPRGFGIEELFKDDEAVFFDGLSDLISKTKMVTNEPPLRMAIAKKGWEKAHRAFNERVVMKYVLERLMNARSDTAYEWPN